MRFLWRIVTSIYFWRLVTSVITAVISGILGNFIFSSIFEPTSFSLQTRAIIIISLSLIIAFVFFQYISERGIIAIALLWYRRCYLWELGGREQTKSFIKGTVYEFINRPPARQLISRRALDKVRSLLDSKWRNNQYVQELIQLKIKGRVVWAFGELREKLQNNQAGSRVLILGESGSGKSTLLEQLSQIAASNAYWFFWNKDWNVFPILARCEMYPGGDIPSFLQESLIISSPKHSQLLSETINDLLSNGTVVLFDGIDDAPTSNYESLIQNLQIFIQSHPKINIIVTSKPGGNFAAKLDLPIYMIQPLPDSSICTLIRQLKPEAQAESVLEKLERTGMLGPDGIGRNPFWLKNFLTCGFTRYKWFSILSCAVKNQINRALSEKARKISRDSLSYEAVAELLGWLAFTMMERQVSTIPTSEVRKLLIQENPNFRYTLLSDYNFVLKKIINEVAVDASILINENELVSFRHRLIRAFFAAVYLNSGQVNNRLLEFIELYHWWEPLTLMTGLLSPTKLISWISHLEDYGKSDTRIRYLAICCLSAWKTGHKDLEKNLLFSLSEIIESRENEEIQRSAIAHIARIGGRYVIELLARVFDHLTLTGRIWLYELMAEIQNPESIKQFVRRGFGDREALDDVMRILIRISNDIVVDQLIDALRDNDWLVKMNSAYALGDIREKRSVKPLVEVLGDDEPKVRASASEALGQVGDESAIPFLIKRLNESEQEVRAAVIHALIRFGDRSIEPLIEALNDRRSMVRINAAKALEGIGGTSIIQPLIQLLKEDEHIDVRSEIAIILGTIGDTIVIQPLIDALQDSETNVQNSAVMALTNIGAPTVQPLIAELNSNNTSVRIGAIRVLGNLKHQDAIDPLTQLLEREEEQYETRCLAATSLGTIGDSKAIGALLNALKSEIPPLRRKAVEALVMIGEPSVAALYELADRDRDWRVRWRAIESLGRIGGKDHQEILIKSLGDQDEEVRRHSVQLLLSIGNSNTSERIIKALEEKKPIDYRYAIEALGRIGDEKAVRFLLIVFEDEQMRDYWPNIAVAMSHSSPYVTASLLKKLTDPDLDVSVNALEALGRSGQKEVVSPIVRSLVKETHSSAKSAAIVSLGRLRAREAVPHLIDALKGNDTKLQKEAAIALGEIQDEQAIKPLFDILKEDLNPGDRPLRKEVVEALGRFKKAPSKAIIALAVPILKNRENEDPKVRLRAAQVLGYYPQDEAIQTLIFALTDDGIVRKEALDALVRIGKPAVPFLVMSLEDERPIVRAEAANALGRIRDPSAVTPLQALLQDSYFDELTIEFPVREAAKRALEGFPI